MNKLIINSVALAISLAFSAGAMAEGMTKVDYKASKEKCNALTDNAKDICVKEAKGHEDVAKAELSYP